MELDTLLLEMLQRRFGPTLMNIPRPEQKEKLIKVQKLGFFKKPNSAIPSGYQIQNYIIKGDSNIGSITWNITYNRKLFCKVIADWHHMDTSDVYWNFCN
jgi:hypothetical protein